MWSRACSTRACVADHSVITPVKAVAAPPRQVLWSSFSCRWSAATSARTAAVRAWTAAAACATCALSTSYLLMGDLLVSWEHGRYGGSPRARSTCDGVVGGLAQPEVVGGSTVGDAD